MLVGLLTLNECGTVLDTCERLVGEARADGGDPRLSAAVRKSSTLEHTLRIKFAKGFEVVASDEPASRWSG